eukprot:scaffold1384_cov116-Cylindrotheca_fusiformis.AAC.50
MNRKSMLRYQMFALLVATASGRQNGPRQHFVVRGGSSSPSYFSPRTPAKTNRLFGSAKAAASNTHINDMDEVSTKEMIDALGILEFLSFVSQVTSFLHAIFAFVASISYHGTARVYAILAGQLVVTASACVLFGVHPYLSTLATQIASGEYQGVLAAIPLIGILVSTVAWFHVCMSAEARQKSPNKWVWLSLFTIGESLSVGFLSSFFEFQSVVVSMLATAVSAITVSAVTILQKNPKYDLSQWGTTLSSWAMVLLVYLIIGWIQQLGWLPDGFLPYSNLAYSIFGSLLFSAFLAHHTKLIVAGKHAKYRMNEKDYVLGAMALYSDIINIFLNLLQILGQEKD